MDLLSWGYVVVAVACVTVGVERLMAATRVSKRRGHLLFGLTAVAAGVDALVQRRFAQAASPEEFHLLFAWSAVSICSFLVLLAWFVDARTGVVRRSLLAVETGLLALTAVLDFLLPSGVHATATVTAVREIALPWGETFRTAVGTASPWRLVGDTANLGFLTLVLDTTVRLVRRGQWRESRLIGTSLLVLGFSILAIIPMDLGLVVIPTVHPFAFLLIVALMSWDLTSSVARAAELSRQVIANERRYRNLIAKSSLLIVEIDTDGRITSVNPAVEAVTGRGAAELVGRPAEEVAPPEEHEGIAAAVREAMAGRAPVESERQIRAADGISRTIVWRSVVLTGANGEVEGLLSLGADVTARRHAEAARDRAQAELERSVVELEDLKRRLEEENLVLRHEVELRHEYEDIVGSSDALLYVLHKIEQIAGTDASVLIHGETGVGKELVARTIHSQSPRSDRPFVAVNCAALAPTLVESELFGHERGAFTGADRQRKGRFEVADGGTLFLDEVGELPLEVQPKLLRVLEQGEVDRVGGARTLQVDVRVIAATNRDLRQDVADGRFREDLFYRLDVYPVTVPPLRERPEDIALLVSHFVRQLNRGRPTPIEEVPPEVMRRLEAYPWPGNIRELRNVVERAALTSSGRVLHLAEPLPAAEGDAPTSAGTVPEVVGRPATLEEVDRQHIRAVLELCQGQISGAGGAAEVLGLHPNTLRSRMQKLGIANPRPGRGPKTAEAPS